MKVSSLVAASMFLLDATKYPKATFASTSLEAGGILTPCDRSGIPSSPASDRRIERESINE